MAREVPCVMCIMGRGRHDLDIVQLFLLRVLGDRLHIF